MKKTLLVLMAAVLIISCSNTTGSPESETPSTPSSHTVTFNLDGGTGTGCENQTIDSGKTAIRPQKDPKKTNAVFKYWSKDKTSEFKFDTAITEDTTLYAVWKTEFAVGDTGPAGGKIFYVATSEQSSTYNSESLTWKYLEAAPEDISGTFWWGNSSTSSLGAKGTGTAVGDGWRNTKILVANFNAAEACRTYGDNSDYDDWFLPSKAELDVMYVKEDVIGGFDCTSSTGIYWSSSEPNDTTKAYATCFYNGLTLAYSRFDNNSSGYKVRAIRAF